MTPPLPTTPATVTDEELKRLLGSAPKRFAFLLRPGPEYGPQTAALQVEHVRNMFGLLRAGVLLSVTALLDGVDVLGVGVMDAASPAEVERVLAEDPAVKGGRALRDPARRLLRPGRPARAVIDLAPDGRPEPR